ncbi:MAG: BatD family protein [Nannocystaceae bacterium]
MPAARTRSLPRAPDAALSRRSALSGLALGFAALAGLAPRRARADGVLSVQARLSTNTAEVSDAVELVVDVSREGGSDDLPEPLLPDFKAMGIAVEGPMTSFSNRTSWINGRSSSSVRQSYVYYLSPQKPGRFELPVQVMDGAAKVRAPSIPVLEVTGAAVTPDAPAPAEAGARPTEARGDVFLWATVDKPQAYVGEQITYDLEVYERVRFQNIHLRELPGFQDFWSEELPEGRTRTEVVAGVGYRVHPGLRRALFPQRAGTLTISAAQVGVGLRRRVSGPTLGIEVLPLPAEGQPPGFSPNNVGAFTLEAAVDRRKVKVGEPFTLTVTIKGTGNIKVIDPGTWPELRGLRRYDPKVETQLLTGEVLGGVRSYAFLVIPEVPGPLTIPAHTFDFFDPSEGRYRRASSPAIEVEAEGEPLAGANAGPTPTAEATNAGGEEDLLLSSIYHPDRLPRVDAPEPWLTPRRWATGMAAVPAIAALGWGVGAISRKVRGDAESQARAARAVKMRALIAEAEAAIPSGEGFHATLSQILQTAAVERTGPAGQGLPRRQLLALLADEGVDAATTKRLGKLLDHCDAARFGASAHDTADARKGMLSESLELVRSRALRPRGE